MMKYQELHYGKHRDNSKFLSVKLVLQGFASFCHFYHLKFCGPGSNRAKWIMSIHMQTQLTSYLSLMMFANLPTMMDLDVQRALSKLLVISAIIWPFNLETIGMAAQGSCAI